MTSECKRFTYGGKEYKIDVPWNRSSCISVRLYCAHHPESSISLGSVWHKRPGLAKAIFKKIKRGQRTRKTCRDCNQDEGMVHRAYAALRPLLLDDERNTQ